MTWDLPLIHLDPFNYFVPDDILMFRPCSSNHFRLGQEAKMRPLTAEETKAVFESRLYSSNCHLP